MPAIDDKTRPTKLTHHPSSAVDFARHLNYNPRMTTAEASRLTEGAALPVPPWRKWGTFVSDRAFCNLAYAGHHATILGGIAGDPRLAEYMNSVRSGLVFFLRPHKELVRQDGVRAGLEWEEVVRIDGMVKLMLEMFSVPYLPVESLSMQERVRLIERVLSLVGAEPRPANAQYLAQAPVRARKQNGSDLEEALN